MRPAAAELVHSVTEKTIDSRFSHLEDELLDAVKSHYRLWSDAHGKERLYGYGFYTPPCVEWVSAVAFSDVGLQRVVEEYRNKPHYVSESPQSLAFTLRWSPADSPYCGSYPEAFEKVNHTLSAISAITHTLHVGDHRFDEQMDLLYRALVHAIRRFRVEKIGGSETPLLSVWFGDQSEKEIDFFVRNCNSASAVDWYYETVAKPM